MSLFVNTTEIQYFEENIFPNLKLEPYLQQDYFSFGLELEYFLVDKITKKPLWYRDLTFTHLNRIFETIDTTEIGGDWTHLEIEPPQKKKLAYVVEGYHVPDEKFNLIDILPKGVEIRTPTFKSIEETIYAATCLFYKLKNALLKEGMFPVAMSHHPEAFEFYGKPNKRRYDYWQWAMEVMTTYGPDINVSIPTQLLKNFQLKDFNAKVDYYSPALASFGLSSPLVKNGPWKLDSGIGKSYRTHRRSIIAPPIEYHAKEGNRFEFKVFEMSPRASDYHIYFLLFLTLVLDKVQLKGRSDKASRTYEFGKVAEMGIEAPGIMDKLMQVIKTAKDILPDYGFDVSILDVLSHRLESKNMLVDHIINTFLKEGPAKLYEQFSHFN